MIPRVQVAAQITEVLGRYVSRMSAEAILKVALRRVGMTEDLLELRGLNHELRKQLELGIATFFTSDAARGECLRRLDAVAGKTGVDTAPSAPVMVSIVDEASVVDARRRARIMAEELGFENTDQIRIATAVSELARNIQRYARTGVVELTPLASPKPGMRIIARDRGPGIHNIHAILAGSYTSTTGMGLGIRGCQRLMDTFAIDTGPGRGTIITLHKYLQR